MNTVPPPRSDDDAGIRSDDPESTRSGLHRKPHAPDSATSDEINFLLSSSLEKPEPDPMLGGSSSVDFPLDAKATRTGTRSADGLNFGVRVAPPSDEVPTAPPARPQSDLWNVVLKSYASAVTLALIWVLWTGRAARPPEAAAPQRDSATARRRAVEPEPPVSSEAIEPRAAAKPSPLRKPILLDDLEITPLTVLRKSVRVSRVQQGADARAVNDRNCLVLTLRIKNLRTDDDLTPVTAQDLWNTASFAIDAPPGAPIAMYTTGLRAGWTIDDQTFPTIKPGEFGDVTLVSEPVSSSRLIGAMVWRFRVATDPDRGRKVDVAVGFDVDDVHSGG